jgi:hypothetical protein
MVKHRHYTQNPRANPAHLITDCECKRDETAILDRPL